MVNAFPLEENEKVCDVALRVHSGRRSGWLMGQRSDHLQCRNALNSFLFLSLLLSFNNYQRTENPNGSSLSPTLSEEVVENLNFETQEILYRCSKVSCHFDMSLYFL